MTTYTIELNDAEVKAMEYVAISVQEWAENALKNRARMSINDIYSKEVERMTADPNITSIPADKNAVVLAANIQSAADRETSEASIP
jgi:hypothetical protein